MAGYGWTAYDVRKGGMQIANDTGNKLELITHFAKVSDDESSAKWGLGVKGIPRANARDHQKTTITFYLGSEDARSRMECTEGHTINPFSSDVVCDGTMVSLGHFKVEIPGHRADGNSLQRTSARV